ncbi:hypothetical protein [Streptomyces sp. NPDC005732]|uniref:hypothetical protein n=1 Tax=Streptomyces sp. NPDC005732 TaxID=3157057 RepID=UPI0033FAA055
MNDVRPVDLPELRAETIRVSGSSRMSEHWARLASTSLTTGQSGEAYRQAFVRGLTEADLYWVSGPMADLTDEGVKTIPEFDLQVEDVPSPHGLIYFTKPIPFIELDNGRPSPVTLAGLLWTAVPGGDGRASLAVYALNQHRGALIPLEVVVLGYGVTVTAWWRVRYVRALHTVWLLMRQQLADTRSVEPDRASRKRMRRDHYEPKAIRVVSLRRPQGASTGGGESSFQHQWIVRGHWRQHWHPKRQVHRPVWIAPHVKGPEGAPMIGGEKVYAWKK